MIGAKAKSVRNEMQEKIMYLERLAFDRGIAELKKPGVEEFEKVVSNSRKQRPGAGAPPGLKGGKASLLVIDDDADIRTVIHEYFTRQGFDVMEAVNSEEGIQCQLEKMADIIIVEILLPGTDGIDTIITIKEKFPDAKIIGMSRGGWYGTDIDFDIAEKLGAQTIHKPFLLKNLEAMVNGFLNGKRVK